MVTLTAPWWLWLLLAVAAVAGGCAVLVAAADGLGWLRQWWRDRREDLSEEEEELAGELREVLAPERTWEQMTSHQLPVVGAVIPPEAIQKRPLDRGWALAVDAHALLHPDRERRAPWWEAEHRAAYESLGFDYPSGLMARVRELTP